MPDSNVTIITIKQENKTESKVGSRAAGEHNVTIQSSTHICRVDSSASVLWTGSFPTWGYLVSFYYYCVFLFFFFVFLLFF